MRPLFNTLASVSIITLHFLTTLTQAQIYQCDKLSMCSCTTENGVIDLSPLKQTPPRTIPGGTSDETFYWQPCDNFDLGTEQNAGCVQQSAGGYFTIGSNTDGTTATGISNDGRAQFVMIAADGARLAQIVCTCDENQDFQGTYNGETPPTNPGDPIIYGFDLTSKYCCPSSGPQPPPGPSGGGGGSEGISVGSVITIGFFAIVIVYVVAGVAFQKTRRGATGKELMPNVGFWGSLPGLVWDGMKFTFTCGKKSGYSSV